MAWLLPGISRHKEAEDVQVPFPLHLEVKTTEVSELHV